jgi:hypothetical protein
MIAKHNRGGKREGAGAPKKYKEETKAKTFRFPLSIAEHIEQQPNGTEYIINLVSDDISREAR